MNITLYLLIRFINKYLYISTFNDLGPLPEPLISQRLTHFHPNGNNLIRWLTHQKQN